MTYIALRIDVDLLNVVAWLPHARHALSVELELVVELAFHVPDDVASLLAHNLVDHLNCGIAQLNFLGLDLFSAGLEVCREVNNALWVIEALDCLPFK